MIVDGKVVLYKPEEEGSFSSLGNLVFKAIREQNSSVEKVSEELSLPIGTENGFSRKVIGKAREALLESAFNPCLGKQTIQELKKLTRDKKYADEYRNVQDRICELFPVLRHTMGLWAVDMAIKNALYNSAKVKRAQKKQLKNIGSSSNRTIIEAGRFVAGRRQKLANHSRQQSQVHQEEESENDERIEERRELPEEGKQMRNIKAGKRKMKKTTLLKNNDGRYQSRDQMKLRPNKVISRHAKSRIPAKAIANVDKPMEIDKTAERKSTSEKSEEYEDAANNFDEDGEEFRDSSNESVESERVSIYSNEIDCHDEDGEGIEEEQREKDDVEQGAPITTSANAKSKTDQDNANSRKDEIIPVRSTKKKLSNKPKRVASLRLPASSKHKKAFKPPTKKGERN